MVPGIEQVKQRTKVRLPTRPKLRGVEVGRCSLERMKECTLDGCEDRLPTKKAKQRRQEGVLDIDDRGAGFAESSGNRKFDPLPLLGLRQGQGVDLRVIVPLAAYRRPTLAPVNSRQSALDRLLLRFAQGSLPRGQ